MCLCNHCYSKKAINIVYYISECVALGTEREMCMHSVVFCTVLFVASGTEREMCMCSVVFCGLPAVLIFPCYCINGTTF